jgi:hypothetical protein
LRTKVALKKAKHLTFLFEPNESVVWHPLKEIRQLPKKYRKAALRVKYIQIVKQAIAQGQFDKYRKKWKEENESTETK